MNEHAIYETVGAKRQRLVSTLWYFGRTANSLLVTDLL